MLRAQLAADGVKMTVEEVLGNGGETWNYMVLEFRFPEGPNIVTRIQVICLYLCGFLDWCLIPCSLARAWFLAGCWFWF